MCREGCRDIPAFSAPLWNNSLLLEDTELKTMQPPGCNTSFRRTSISSNFPPCPPIKTASGRGRGSRSVCRKSPIKAVIPGAPKRRELMRISSSPSGRISNETTVRCGNCRRASMETEPVQKPMSQKTRRRFSSNACKVRLWLSCGHVRPSGQIVRREDRRGGAVQL